MFGSDTGVFWFYQGTRLEDFWRWFAARYLGFVVFKKLKISVQRSVCNLYSPSQISASVHLALCKY